MKFCKDCGHPMVPFGKGNRLSEYAHAQGCPSGPTPKRQELAERILQAIADQYDQCACLFWQDCPHALEAIERVLAEHDEQERQAALKLSEETFEEHFPGGVAEFRRLEKAESERSIAVEELLAAAEAVPFRGVPWPWQIRLLAAAAKVREAQVR